jgi:hypothetical protein
VSVVVDTRQRPRARDNGVAFESAADLTLDLDVTVVSVFCSHRAWVGGMIVDAVRAV